MLLTVILNVIKIVKNVKQMMYLFVLAVFPNPMDMVCILKIVFHLKHIKTRKLTRVKTISRTCHWVQRQFREIY